MSDLTIDFSERDDFTEKMMNHYIIDCHSINKEIKEIIINKTQADLISSNGYWREDFISEEIVGDTITRNYKNVWVSLNPMVNSSTDDEMFYESDFARTRIRVKDE